MLFLTGDEMKKLYYVRMDTDIDKYEYLTLDKPEKVDFETVREFEICTTMDILEALESLEDEFFSCSQLGGSVFDLNGLEPCLTELNRCML